MGECIVSDMNLVEVVVFDADDVFGASDRWKFIEVCVERGWVDGKNSKKRGKERREGEMVMQRTLLLLRAHDGSLLFFAPLLLRAGLLHSQ